MINLRSINTFFPKYLSIYLWYIRKIEVLIYPWLTIFSSLVVKLFWLKYAIFRSSDHGWDGMRDLVGLDIIVDTGENMVTGDGISWTGGKS